MTARTHDHPTTSNMQSSLLKTPHSHSDSQFHWWYGRMYTYIHACTAHTHTHGLVCMYNKDILLLWLLWLVSLCMFRGLSVRICWCVCVLCVCIRMGSTKMRLPIINIAQNMNNSRMVSNGILKHVRKSKSHKPIYIYLRVLMVQYFFLAKLCISVTKSTNLCERYQTFLCELTDG